MLKHITPNAVYVYKDLNTSIDADYFRKIKRKLASLIK